LAAARANALLLLCLALAGHQAASAAPIFGSWQLDAEQSDSIRKLMPPKGGKGKQHADKGKEPGLDSPPAQHNKPNPFPMLSASTLRINNDNEQVEIIADKGSPLRIVPDGNAAPVSLSNWGSQSNPPVRFSLWEGDALVMESSLDEGTHVTQRYYVNEQGLLVQATEITRIRSEPIVVKRRFKPVERAQNDNRQEIISGK
jgi:hypothetical protein